MFWIHISSFVIILITFELKKKGYHDLKQLLQFVLMACYFIAAWYTVYITKINLEDWTSDVNGVRIWLYMESAYIYKWIFSSIIFVTMAHVFKF